MYAGCARVRCSLVDLIIGQFFSTSNRAWCRPFAHGFPLPLPAPNFGGSNESGVLYGFTFVKIFHLVSQDLLLPFVKFLSLCFTYKLNPVCHFASPSRLLQPSSLLCWSVSVWLIKWVQIKTCPTDTRPRFCFFFHLKILGSGEMQENAHF